MSLFSYCVSFFFLGNTPSSCPGYDFTSEEGKRCSYLYFLDSTKKLNQEGSDIDMNTWLTSSFFLPFRTTFEIDSLSGGLSERVQQNPVNSNGKYSLYLKFSEATTYVLRIICVYRCQRYLQINNTRNCFKSHELEQ